MTNFSLICTRKWELTRFPKMKMELANPTAGNNQNSIHFVLLVYQVYVGYRYVWIYDGLSDASSTAVLM